MPVSALAIEQASEIQRVFEDRYAKEEKVVGVGLGLNERGNDLALNVQVSDQSAVADLPKTFSGLEVIVDVVGEVEAY